MRDVQFRADALGEMALVKVAPRKKGARSQGKASVVVVRDGSLLRPVSALRRYLSLRGPNGSAPLFVWKGRPLTNGKVTQLVRATMEAAGVDPRPFSSHSLRIGGATAALAAGVPPEAIRVMGRWDSEVYEIYCRRSKQLALRLGRVVASTAVDDMPGAFEDEELV